MLDTILFISTIVMLLVILVAGWALLKSGTRPAEVIQDVCSLMTYSVAGNNKQTLIWNIAVVVSLVIFNYIWPVPMYTTLIVATWAICWVIQLFVRSITEEEFGNMHEFGFKLARVIVK